MIGISQYAGVFGRYVCGFLLCFYFPLVVSSLSLSGHSVTTARLRQSHGMIGISQYGRNMRAFMLCFSFHLVCLLRCVCLLLVSFAFSFLFLSPCLTSFLRQYWSGRICSRCKWSSIPIYLGYSVYPHSRKIPHWLCVYTHSTLTSLVGYTIYHIPPVAVPDA